MRTMYDVLYLPNPAPNYEGAAGYLASPGISHPWSVSDWSRAKAVSRWLLPIAGWWTGHNDPVGDANNQRAQMDTLGFGKCAVGLDIEAPVATQATAYVDTWALAVSKRGDYPVIYTSASFGGLFGGHNLWLAEWNNVPHIIPGSVATQYAAPSSDASLNVDLSLVIDSVPLWDTKPVVVPPKTEVDMVSVLNQDGHPEDIWLGDDGKVYHRYRALTGGAWNGPFDFTDNLPTPVTRVSAFLNPSSAGHPGCVEVHALANGTWYSRVQTMPNNGWNAWTPM